MLSQGISSQAFSNAASCQAQGGSTTWQNSLNYDASNRISSGTWLDSSHNTHTGHPEYDDAGNMTNDGTNTYLYDAEGQVCAVQTGPNAFTGYLYDAEGTRSISGRRRRS